MAAFRLLLALAAAVFLADCAPNPSIRTAIALTGSERTQIAAYVAAVDANLPGIEEMSVGAIPVRRMHDDLQQLMLKYYPRPFPG